MILLFVYLLRFGIVHHFQLSAHMALTIICWKPKPINLYFTNVISACYIFQKVSTVNSVTVHTISKWFYFHDYPPLTRPRPMSTKQFHRKRMRTFVSSIYAAIWNAELSVKQIVPNYNSLDKSRALFTNCQTIL